MENNSTDPLSRSQRIGRFKKRRIPTTKLEKKVILSQLDVKPNLRENNESTQAAVLGNVRIKEEPIDERDEQPNFSPLCTDNLSSQQNCPDLQPTAKRKKLVSHESVLHPLVTPKLEIDQPVTKKDFTSLPAIVSVESLAKTLKSANATPATTAIATTVASTSGLNMRPTLTLVPKLLNSKSYTLKLAYLHVLPPKSNESSKIETKLTINSGICEQIKVEPQIEDLEGIAINEPEELLLTAEEDSYILPDVTTKFTAPSLINTTSEVTHELRDSLSKQTEDKNSKSAASNIECDLSEGSTQESSCSNKEMGAKGHRISYFEESDMLSAEKSKDFFLMAKQVMTSQNELIKNFRRTLAKIKLMIDVLKSENEISEDAARKLEMSFNKTY